MKLIAAFLFLISVSTVYSQTDKATGHVSYTIEFDSMRPAKDGYWYHEYLFEIDETKLPLLTGKKIKISGRYITIEDRPLTKIGKDGKIIHLQGRRGGYKVINKPKVKIIK